MTKQEMEIKNVRGVREERENEDVVFLIAILDEETKRKITAILRPHE